MQKSIAKDQWVGMFREIGLDDAAMKKWHQIFEKRHPQGHQAFLEWLGLSPAEVQKVRSESH